jgi:hypothetical protein
MQNKRNGKNVSARERDLSSFFEPGALAQPPSLRADWRRLRPLARGSRLPGSKRARDGDVLFRTKTKHQS